MTEPFSVGDRVWFEGEVKPYTVQAVSVSGRYVACTKPFAARKTVIYSMVDTVEKLRGVDNSIGNSLGYETTKDCQEAVEVFESGEFKFSGRRKPIPLRVVRQERSHD